MASPTAMRVNHSSVFATEIVRGMRAVVLHSSPVAVGAVAQTATGPSARSARVTDSCRARESVLVTDATRRSVNSGNRSKPGPMARLGGEERMSAASIAPVAQRPDRVRRATVFDELSVPALPFLEQRQGVTAKAGPGATAPGCAVRPWCDLPGEKAGLNPVPRRAHGPGSDDQTLL